MSCSIECLNQERTETCQSHSGCDNKGFCFRDPNDPAGSNRTQILVQERWPILGTQVANPKAVIDQIKIIIRKFEYTKCIHNMKFHTITDPLCECLCSCIFNHLVADIYSH